MVGGNILDVLVANRVGQRGQRLDRLTTGGRGGRQRAEIPLRRTEPLLGGEVTHQGEHGVVGAVVGAEELVHVLHAGSVKVGHRPDRRVVVRVALGEDRRVDVDQGVAVGQVVVTLPLLLLDPVSYTHLTLPTKRIV